MKKLNFRQKTLISQLVLFFLFILISLPLMDRSVDKVLISSLETSSEEIVHKISQVQSEEEMIHLIKKSQAEFVFKIALYDEQGLLLYGSSLGDMGSTELKAPPSHIILPEDIHKMVKNNEPVYEVIKKSEDRNALVLISIPFELQAKKYVLQSTFPYRYIDKFSDRFSVWFIVFCILALLFFGALTYVIFGRLHRPIFQLIQAIKTYQAGNKEKMPVLLDQEVFKQDEDFLQLAKTLRSLYEEVQGNIKHLEEERNEKEAILESLAEGVIAVDGQMNVRYVNFIASKMLGLPKRYLLLKPFPKPSEKSNQQLFEKCRALLLAVQSQKVILTDALVIEEGKKIYLDLIAAPRALGNGAIVVLQDKSSQYKVLEMGKDFVANASHELRTPITIIRGFAETLQDLGDIPPDMFNDILEKIIRNCERMDNLVKSLLTLADIENLSTSRFQDCDLIALAESCRHLVEIVHIDAKIKIEKDLDSVVVHADPDVLELAILNLMENAAKYSRPPAEIIVRIKVEQDEAIISISDKGIGIPKKDLEHIFERFYTVDKAHSRRLGGAGLGLSLVKTIIEKHDGTISVESEVEKGSTFTITLPLKQG